MESYNKILIKGGKIFLYAFLGLIAPSGMSYYVKQEENNRTGEPSLEEMTEKAIEILSKNPKGFFLMIEGVNNNNSTIKYKQDFSQTKYWSNCNEV